MSSASASVTTSASRPSITERACLPEPPCDCLIATFSPAFACQYLANAGLKSWYSSRVGSYDALRIVTSAWADVETTSASAAASLRAKFIFSRYKQINKANNWLYIRSRKSRIERLVRGAIASADRSAFVVSRSLRELGSARLELRSHEYQRGTGDLRARKVRKIAEGRVMNALLGQRGAFDDRHRQAGGFTGCDQRARDQLRLTDAHVDRAGIRCRETARPRACRLIDTDARCREGDAACVAALRERGSQFRGRGKRCGDARHDLAG